MANILKNVHFEDFPSSEGAQPILEVETQANHETREILLEGNYSGLASPPTFHGLSLDLADKPRDVVGVTLEETYQAGYAKGLIEGGQQKETELHDQFVTLSSLLQSIPQAIENNRQQLASEIADIVLFIAQQFFIQQRHDKTAIIHQIHQIIHQLNHQHTLEIALHPNDLKHLQSEKIQLDLEISRKIRFITDEKLRLGGCVIRSPHGMFDASIERQIDNLKQVLLQIQLQQSPGKWHAIKK